MRILKSILIFLSFVYVLGCIGLYLFQNQIIFDPHELPESHQFRIGGEVEIPVAAGISLNTWVRDIKNPKGVIIYFHGNRGNIRRCIRQAMSFAPSDYKVYMPDYRGYGKSEGQLSTQKQLLSDANSVFEYVKNENPNLEIHLVGFSLGSGIASYLASIHHNVEQLILVAPYKSFIDLKNRYFPIVPNFLIKFPLSNSKYLQDVQCPITLYHGTEDKVIPFDSSLSLEKIAPTRIQLFPLEGVGHRGAIFSRRIAQTF